MSTVNLKESLTSSITVLKICGLWPIDTLKHPNIYRYYLWISFFMFTASSFIFCVQNFENLEELASTSYITMSCSACLWKIVLFNRKLSEIKTIIQDLSQEQCFQSKNKKQEDILKMGVKISQFFVSVVCFVATNCLLMYALMPVITQQRILPYKAWIPYDLTSEKLYIATYLWQNYIVFLISYVTCCVDSIFAILMLYIGLQCQIICDKIENLYQNTTDLKQDLINCILHYQKVVE